MLVACGGKEEPVPPTPQDSLSVSPNALSFTEEDTSTKLITVSASGSWSASASAGWIHVSPASGSGNGSLSVKVDANTGENARTGSVDLACGSKKASVSVSQSGAAKVAIVPAPAAFDGNKRASTTYQLLVYTFADSDGDGVGDFKGIQNKLDYLDGLGVTALWLSPAHPTNSYHGYDVNDYAAVNPLYGTEADFKSLVDAAHAKGIKIYMDFVLNHSGTGSEWFKSVKADPKNSPYKDYYVLSTDPTADGLAGKIDNYGGSKSPNMGGWFSLGDGNIGYKGRLHFKVDWTGSTKYVTVTETTEAPQNPNTTNAERWIHVGSKGSLGMYKTANNIYELTIDVDTNWGFLVRTSNSDSWPAGTKYGGSAGNSVITLGKPFPLDNSTASDIVFGETTYYYGAFGSSMPDLNYGKYTECEQSGAFKATVDAAAKWVNLGVDGFRLDAVIWVYNAQIPANQRFLDQWYQAVNTAYKAAGHTDNIFIVGEAWDDHNVEKQYYKGLISNFEFNYGGMVSNMLNNTNATGYVNAVRTYITDHTSLRPDAVTSFFLTNHDQDRFAEWVGKNPAKEKQAAALLLTSPGKPFFYQGEELGYYGTKSGGDEYVRAPIVWDSAAQDCAKKGVNNKVDNTMLKGGISVQTQSADENSLLNTYVSWSRLRNTYPALATGEMTPVSLSGSSFAAWYMTSGSQKLLVVHNCAGSEKSVTVSDSMTKPIALLGNGFVKEQTLILGPNSSVVFQLSN